MLGIVCLIGLYLQIPVILMRLKRLDQHWQHQDTGIYDFRTQIEGTGSRSEVLRVNLV